MVAEDQNEAGRRVGLPVIPSPLQGGMRRCGSSRTKSIKRATTPLGVGVMTPAIRRCCVGGKGERGRRRPVCCSDGEREFGEGRGEAVSGIDIEAEFVVAAADVLHEGMPRSDHSYAAQLFESAHRP